MPHPRRALLLLLGLLLTPWPSLAAGKPVAVRCGRLIDGLADEVRAATVARIAR